MRIRLAAHPVKLFSLFIPAALLGVWSAVPLQAQDQDQIIWIADTLVAGGYDAFTYITPVQGAGKTGAAAATFFFDFDDDFPTEARNALQFAANIWASHLTSSVPIVVEAEWDALGNRTLASAGPRLGRVPEPNTWYPTALGNALTGDDNFPNSPDIEATFNSQLDVNNDGQSDWYFGTDGNTPPGRYDFVSVALHELGHGLGFTGSLDIEDGNDSNGINCDNNAATGQGCWGIQSSSGLLPFIFDRFTEDANEVPLLNTLVYPNPSLTLADVLQSDAIFFNGDFSRFLNTDVPISLFAPLEFEQGSTYSHVDEGTFPAGDPNSLMTPTLNRAEAVHSPGPLLCAMLRDIGWTLGSDCVALTGNEPVNPIDEVFTLSGFYPNPGGSTARVNLEVQETQVVQFALFDAMGRQITSFSRSIGAQQAPTPIGLNGLILAPGVYYLRVTGQTFTATRTLVYVGP
jgi:hypothetical protein